MAGNKVLTPRMKQFLAECLSQQYYYRTVFTISVRKGKKYLGHIKYFFPVWAKKKTAEMSPSHTHFNLTTHRCEKTPRVWKVFRPSLNAKQALLNTFPL